MSRRRKWALALLLVGFSSCDRFVDSGSSRVDVVFAPSQDGSSPIVKELEAAKESILFQGGGCLSSSVAFAAADAYKRGVRVEYLGGNRPGLEEAVAIDALRSAGIPVDTDVRHSLACGGVVVIDGRTTIFGTCSLGSSEAEEEAKLLLVIRDTAIAEKFSAQWKTHSLHGAGKAAAETESLGPSKLPPKPSAKSKPPVPIQK